MLLLDVAHQLAGIDLGSINDAIGIGRDALRGATCTGTRAFLYGERIGNERGHFPVLGAADIKPALEARILRVVRFGIRCVQHIVLVDEDSARPTELLPFGKELAVLIEYLDAAVGAVSDEQAARRIEGQ